MPKKSNKRAGKSNKRAGKTKAAALAKSKGKQVAFGEKARFVKSLPIKMPASQVIALGAEQGISISENHVYNTRKQMKTEGTSSTTPASLVDVVQSPLAVESGKPAEKKQASNKAKWTQNLKNAIFWLGYEDAWEVFRSMAQAAAVDESPAARR